MTYNDFEEALDDDLGWRKVEISNLLLIAKNTNEEVILKSIILLLYAHWEGYIKQSSKYYIRYLNEKNLRLGTLTGNFKAFAIKGNVSQCIDGKNSLNLANEINFINRFLKLDTRNFIVPVDTTNPSEKAVIDTESNLKPKVFKNIISILGLNYCEAIETRERYIDSHLLGNRNQIGHGNKYRSIHPDFNLEIKDVEKLKDIIFSIIDNFRDELLEHSRCEYYLHANATELEKFNRNQSLKLERLLKSIEDLYI